MGITIDRSAITTGVLTTALFAVPLALGASWAGSRGEDGIALWCNIGVLVAFIIGAGCAAWIQNSGFPIANGVFTAVSSFVLITLVGIVVAVTRGESPHWFRQLFLLTLTIGMGVIGGLLGGRLRASGMTPRDRGGSQPD